MFVHRECFGSTAKDCLTLQTDRPTTPPELKKYRRSTYIEPGRRFQHSGIADDLSRMNLEARMFGIRSDKGNGTAEEVVSGTKLTEAERLVRIKNEKIYKSTAQESLGQKMDRKVTFPSKFTEGKTPFGIKSKSSTESASEILFPHVTDESMSGDDLYRRSHGNYAPGEQKRRNYNWPVDPETAVFGRKAGTNALNGASTNVAIVLKESDADSAIISKKSIEDFRNTGDVLGMSRNLGQGSGSRPLYMVYGQPSAAILRSRKIYTAAEVIRGNYSTIQQLPDHDLGKSITPGFRNFTSSDRVFGCPSIRTDLQHTRQGRRSVADAQNYGDDVPAKYLINPPPFSDLSISPDAMAISRSKEKIFNIFDQIGYAHIPLDVKEVIFQEASPDGLNATINAYRMSLNCYLDAIETNQEEAWLREKGITSNQLE